MSTQEKKISFAKLCTIEDKVSQYDWKPDDVFYTIEDIKKYLEPNIKKHFNFAIWLLQKKPENKYEAEAKSYLMNLVNSQIEGDD